jgi:hypothetical protein
MSVQPPGSAAPMIIGGRAGRGHCIGAAAHSHRAVDRGSPRGARAWQLLAAAGLAFGLITIVTPVLATATVATTMILATIHVITGLVWFILVWRAAR